MPLGPPSENVERLYRQLSDHLERRVREGVWASEEVIEDACQSAWTGLVGHWDVVRPDSELAWLTTTAVRAALKLARRDRREASLDALLEAGDGDLLPGHLSSAEETGLQRARLESLAVLPRRQQRTMWLRAAGFSYREMAERAGESRRSIERQLSSARRTARELEL